MRMRSRLDVCEVKTHVNRIHVLLESDGIIEINWL